MTEDDIARLQAQADGAARETIQRLLDILLAEEETMRRTQDPRLHLETAVVRMAYLEELVPIEEVLGRMEALEKKLSAGTARTAAAAPNRPSQPAPTLPAAVDTPAPTAVNHPLPSQVREEPRQYSAGDAAPEQRWMDYKSQVKKESPSLGSNIAQGTFIGYAEGVLTVGFPPGFACDYVREKEHLERLTELARPFFDDHVKVKVEVVKPDPGDQAGKPNGTVKSNHDVRQEAMNHPLLQKAIDLFEGAEIREIIPRKNS